MKKSPLARELLLIQVLAWFQRTIRLCIRAAWTGAAGYLIGWGSNSLWGWLPESRYWLFIGIFLALFSIASIFYPWPRLSRLAWSLDRRLGLKEQVSTAHQVDQHPTTGMMGIMLITETAARLPEIRIRVFRRGWFLERDFVSALIVTALIWLVFSGNTSTAAVDLPQAQAALLLPLGKDPLAEDIFPSGIPGLKPEPTVASSAPNPQSNNEGVGDQQNIEEDKISEFNAINAALMKLGEILSQQAAAFDAGDALQRGDLDRAADALEALADQIDQLAAESKRQLAAAMQATSNEISQTGQGKQHPLAIDLQEAARALEREDNLSSKQALAGIASDLRDFADQLANLATSQTNQEEGSSQDQGVSSGGSEGGMAAGQRERGEPEPITRIQGEGETFELGEISDQSGLLRPGINLERGEPVAVGSSDFVRTGDSSVITSVLTPYYYSWVWRDVVTSYFSPR